MQSTFSNSSVAVSIHLTIPNLKLESKMKFLTLLVTAACMSCTSAQYSNITVQALAALNNYTATARASAAAQGLVFSTAEISALASYTAEYGRLFTGALAGIAWSPLGVIYYTTSCALTTLTSVLTSASLSLSIASQVAAVQGNFSASIAVDTSAFYGLVALKNVSEACWNASKPQLKAIYDKSYASAANITNLYCAQINSSVQAYKTLISNHLATINFNASATCNVYSWYLGCTAYVSYLPYMNTDFY